MIERVAEVVNPDSHLVRRGRFLSTTFMWHIGEAGYLVEIIEARIVSITPRPFVTPNRLKCCPEIVCQGTTEHCPG
jgi:hypothetical protein